MDESAPVVQMGIDCPQDTKGDYYLQTGGEYPYSNGLAGLKYNAKQTTTNINLCLSGLKFLYFFVD